MVRRRGLVVVGLGALLIALFLARTLLGDFPIALTDAVRLLSGGSVDVPGASYIFWESKLPRALAGALGGAVFGACGAAMQSLVRNPLASPDVLGISLGASTAGIFAVTIMGWTGPLVLAAALLGAALASGMILLLARGSTPRMLLTGIALAAALQAAIQWILVRANAFQALDAMVWLAGSLGGVTWEQVATLAVGGSAVIATLGVLTHRLRVLELGRNLAAGLGVDDGGVRRSTFAAVVVGIAVATSACGPIAFVALLCGPIAARLSGRTSPLTAALVGGCLTLAADYIGAYLIPGGAKLPVGVITGLAGAPALAWLLVAGARRGVSR